MTEATAAGGTGAAAAASAGRREALLRMALDPETDPEVLSLVAQEESADEAIHLALIRNPGAGDQVWQHIAQVGSLGVLQEIAAQEARLRAHLSLARAILLNPAADEALRRAAKALLGESTEGPRPAAGLLDRSQLLQIARDPQAEAAALNVVAREAGADQEINLALARHPRATDAILVYLALVGTPAVLQEILAKGERLRSHPAIAQAMLENEEANDALRVKIRAVLNENPSEEATKPAPLYQLIKGMSTGQRLAFAMKGSKEARMLLIKDPNEMVALEVIYSPRITENEILAIAQMRDVSEQVLRTIASNKQYRAKKQILWALLNNPKTPAGVSIGLNLGNLSEKELAGLMKNRNIPSALQRAVRAALEKKQRRSGGHGH